MASDVSKPRTSQYFCAPHRLEPDPAHLLGRSLQSCSPDYQIIEAADGQSGLDSYRSRRIDCVVLEIDLPDRSGLEVLMTLIPHASKPRIAVIVLTQLSHPGVWRLTKENGAYASLVKGFTSGQDLDKAIQRAVAFVGQMPKDDRYRPI
jgi:DNA-binding NarL/FixJ family response regulator